MDGHATAQQLSPGLEWKIGEIPGEDGWLGGGQQDFEEVAVLLTRAGVPDETITELLQRIYWSVANTYGR